MNAVSPHDDQSFINMLDDNTPRSQLLKKKMPPWQELALCPLRQNVIEWFPFSRNDTVVELNGGYGEFTETLVNSVDHVYVFTSTPLQAEIIKKRCHYPENLTLTSRDTDAFIQAIPSESSVFLIHNIDQFENKEFLLKLLSEIHKRFPKAIVLLLCENTNGYRYNCVINSESTQPLSTSMFFQKDELDLLIKAAGYSESFYYYLYPDSTLTMSLFSDHFNPGPEHLTIYDLKKLQETFPHTNETEWFAAQTAASKGTFSSEANSYLLILGHIHNFHIPSYIRYSNQRSDIFSIRTEIFDHSQVKKTALEKAGRRHIDLMQKNSQHLKQQYAGTILTVPEINSNKGELTYHFINGKSLEELADLALQDGEPHFLFLLEQWKDEISSAHDDTFFSLSKDFIRVFGHYLINQDYRCGKYNNIDLSFQNIFINNGKWYAIDSEWTFDFPIPVQFILYRGFSYYSHQKNLDKPVVDKCWEILQINESERACFAKLERHFQKYIRGNKKTYL